MDVVVRPTGTALKILPPARVHRPQGVLSHVAVRAAEARPRASAEAAAVAPSDCCGCRREPGLAWPAAPGDLFTSATLTS